MVMEVWFLKKSNLLYVDVNEGHAMLMDTLWKVAMASIGNSALLFHLCPTGFFKSYLAKASKRI